MEIEGIIWLEHIIEKLWIKHRVDVDEVEQVFENQPHFRRIERGDVEGEDLYTAIGQTGGGRYLVVFFIYKQTHNILIISARETTQSERRRYAR